MRIMVKNTVSLFSIPACCKLISAALLCALVLCGCGETGDTNKPITVDDPPVIDVPPVNDPDGNRSINNVPPWGTHEGLSAEIEWRIRQDYFDFLGQYGIMPSGYTVKDFWIIRYYGIYNDCVAIMMDGRGVGHTGEVWDIITGDTLFVYGSSNTIYAWKEGRFYGLNDAYNQGLLTRENLMNIAYYHHGAELNLENHAGLLGNVGWDIRRAYLKTYLKPNFPEVDIADIHNVYVQKYYGSYKYIDGGNRGGPLNDCVAVMIATEYDDYTDEPWETVVANTLFRYSNGNRILLWKYGTPDERELGTQGHFYELQEAYNLGFLTEDDVRSIAYYHGTGTAISYKYDF